MTNPARTLARARQLHHEGLLEEAERLYLHALEESPALPDGLHLLGLLHADSGRPDTAAQLLAAAIGIQGPVAHLCRNLGILLERDGKPQEALACYRQALDADPSATDLWEKAAHLLAGLNRYGEAAAAWKRAIESSLPGDPREASWHSDTGKMLALSGDLPSAAEAWRRSLFCRPAQPEVHFNLGTALLQLDRPAEARRAFRDVLRWGPAHARAHNNLAILLHAAGRSGEARTHYEASVTADPAYLDARYNLATLLQEAGDHEHAGQHFETVLAGDPSRVDVWTNLGNCLLARNYLSAALTCYDRALDLEPSDPSAAWNRGIAQLTRGEFPEGWAGYERRFDVPGSPARRVFPVPAWAGEPLSGKSILIHAEQGLGDTIQFCRFLPLLVLRGARVHFECQPALLSLLGSLAGSVELLPSGADLPCTGFHLPLMSLPAVLGTTLESIPSATPYLHPPAERVAYWRARLAPLSGTLRCGIVWQGNSRHHNDRFRSLPVEALRPLAGLPGVALVNLQFGCPAPEGLVALDLGLEVGDFADTAALVRALDLVITVDTSLAHLAGALHQPACLLLAHSADWRWMLDRQDSPWYPSLQLFRQPTPGDWASAVTALAGELLRQTKTCTR